jgi:spermidine synthase
MRAAVLAIFLASGACGLLYEVVWVRAAGTVIGNSSYAVGTVVAVYMGGLALGAWLGGREADRRSGARLLSLYAALEFGIAATAVAAPWLFAASEPLFRLLWGAVGGLGLLWALLRAALVAAVLLVPTTLMGATLPILSRWLSTDGGSVARQAGVAYAVNTLGGVAGTLAAGFWLIPSMGLRATTFLAAGLNVAVAGVAWSLGRKGGGSLPAPAPERPAPVAVAAAALAGFASLVYEVAWTRSLVLSIGSTVHAFTLILAAFILGLALGSAGASWLVARIRADAALGGIQAGVAVLALALLPFLGDLPLLLAADPADPLSGAPAAALFVLVPSILMGAAFPFLCSLARPSERSVGRGVGAVYTANTLGSIAGSVGASFALIPLIGLNGSIRLAATVNLALAAFLAFRWKRPSALVPAAAIAAAWILPAWDLKVLASGSFLYGKADAETARSRRLSLREYLHRDTELIGEFWDAYGLVTVHRQRDGVLSMRVNGKTDASTGPSDRPNMLFLAHVPLLHHPAPKRALLIGLGGGLTLGALTKHPLERIDCVDISPAVIRASRLFGAPLDDPRVRMIEGDGRNALLFGREPYDVILSQPSNLWVSGMANLFTRECFEEAAARLAPGGVFCQWVHAYWLPTEDFRQVLRTFFSVFPEGGLWEVFPGSDYLLVGHREPLPPPSRSHPELEEHLAAGGLGAHRVAGRPETLAASGTGPLLTDDRCTLEYTAPRGMGRDTRAELLRWMGGFRSPEARPELARAVGLFSERRAVGALDALAGVLIRDPRSRVFLDEVCRANLEIARRWIPAGRTQEAIERLEKVPPESSVRPEAQVEIGNVFTGLGDFREAETRYKKARGSAVGAIALAELSMFEGRIADAEPLWREAVGLDPAFVPSRVRLAECLVKLGRRDEAREAVRKALELEPGDERARRLEAELR